MCRTAGDSQTRVTPEEIPVKISQYPREMLPEAAVVEESRGCAL